MILSEEHRIKKHNNAELLREIDNYCYKVKNLSNSINYLIKQCYRIHTKIKNGKTLEEWEDELIRAINSGITEYNLGRSERNAESGSRSTGRQQNMGKIRRSLRNIRMYRGISTQKQEEVLL